MRRPPAAFRAAVLPELERTGVLDRLGSRLFTPENWHQSLSDLLLRDSLEIYRRAGSRVAAAPFVLRFDRVSFAGGHARLEPSAASHGFAALLRSVRAALDAEGEKSGRHAPHITLSYRAPSSPETVMIDPIDWTIDSIELVEVVSYPYGYRTLDSWPLAPAIEPQSELPF
ncbi:2'-5' RNA ligase family protein [Lysobacter claricitrinus]|uniref:2'-5' RNA ligase family protein n=1 Tax=Lysobacter claricitrinus TaxID=3367728 RepID=UPI0038B25818